MLANMAWPDLVDSDSVLVVPMGSTEQHGPHLPLDTDTAIAVEVATRLVEAVPRLLLAPSIAIGASGEHAGFPGTLSVGSAVLEEMVVEISRSADAFAGVIWLNAHGGNSEALRRAVARLDSEGRRSLMLRCSIPGGDAHAGRTETSIMLAIDPSRVSMGRAAAGVTDPWAELADRILAGGVIAVTDNGVLGDPLGATAAEGEHLLVDLVDRSVATVARWLDD